MIWNIWCVMELIERHSRCCRSICTFVDKNHAILCKRHNCWTNDLLALAMKFKRLKSCAIFQVQSTVLPRLLLMIRRQTTDQRVHGCRMEWTTFITEFPCFLCFPVYDFLFWTILQLQNIESQVWTDNSDPRSKISFKSPHAAVYARCSQQ